MSYFFILNNIHFAIETFGALAFLIGAGLAYDALSLKKDFAAVSRLVSFIVLAIWQILNAANLMEGLNVYLASLPLIVGLVLLLLTLHLESQFKQSRMTYAMIIVSLLVSYISVAATIILLSLGISYIGYRQFKKEYKVVIGPFYKAFIFIGLSYILPLFASSSNVVDPFVVLSDLAKIVGFGLLFWWAWQYLQLRIREEINLLFFSGALIVSTIVTLAFSSILVSYVNNATKDSLQTDVKFFDYSIDMLKSEFLAKTKLFAAGDSLLRALGRGDELALTKIATDFSANEGLGFMTIVSANGDVVARANAPVQRGENLGKEDGVKSALAGKSHVTSDTDPSSGLSILISVPIYSGNKIIGAAIAGVPFDNALVDNIKRITGLEMSVYQKDLRVATTVLNPDGRTRTANIKETDKDVIGGVLGGGQQVTKNIEILSQSYYVSYLPLKNAAGANIGMISAMKPEKDIVSLLNTTNRLTLVTVAIIMLIMMVPIYFLTERLTAEI